jgi:hypothetical protein
LCCKITEPANARDLITASNGWRVLNNSFVFAFTYTLGRFEGATLAKD